jgi:hypothetical protein
MIPASADDDHLFETRFRDNPSIALRNVPERFLKAATPSFDFHASRNFPDLRPTLGKPPGPENS